MIVFGSVMTDPDAYRLYARPGIARAAEADSEVYAFAAVGTISRGYNLLLERAAEEEDLEALVLLHQEVEIDDPEFCSKLREALKDPSVGAVGCVGATGVRSIAWWEGEISCGTVTQKHQQYGGGAQPAFCFKPLAPAPAEVEMVDGLLMVLSPWAVRNLRFDESLWLGHGYDLDFCLRVREAGRRVVTADFHVTQHHADLELVEDLDLWTVAYMQAAEKLEERLGTESTPPGSWKPRARRAEAARDAARTTVYSTAYLADAELAPLEREVEKMENSLSWRVTRPLRELNLRRAEAAKRNGG